MLGGDHRFSNKELFVTETELAAMARPARVGYRRPNRSLELMQQHFEHMIHIWIFPQYRNSLNAFAGLFEFVVSVFCHYFGQDLDAVTINSISIL
ncbi:hypothetical protein [Candidatus Nitrosotalea okcheonensis]|uniref:hypothetical protein n=1 Tax=Candidatus Nitrosotalea okcheonensis TaxID=1903276 RepID=UPI001E3DDA36|nr:hypothetical protein [Candidatus Nitrosotalea okcheonensis]